MFSTIRKTASTIYGLFKDPVVAELDIQTTLGNGFLLCQVRRKKSDQCEYVVLKSKGGDSTIWVTLDRPGVDMLMSFLSSAYAPRKFNAV